MSIIPWRGKRQDAEIEPFRALDTFRTEMDRMFDRFFGGDWPIARMGGFGNWLPTLDVAETDKDITVRAEVPGLDPEDLDISVTGQVLTISGEKKESSEKKDENFYHSERRFGSFRRSVTLPVSVDAEKVSAKHKNGVVTIVLPKLESERPKRIPVKEG